MQLTSEGLWEKGTGWRRKGAALLMGKHAQAAWLHWFQWYSVSACSTLAMSYFGISWLQFLKSCKCGLLLETSQIWREWPCFATVNFQGKGKAERQIHLLGAAYWHLCRRYLALTRHGETFWRGTGSSCLRETNSKSNSSFTCTIGKTIWRSFLKYKLLVYIIYKSILIECIWRSDEDPRWAKIFDAPLRAALRTANPAALVHLLPERAAFGRLKRLGHSARPLSPGATHRVFF